MQWESSTRDFFLKMILHCNTWNTKSVNQNCFIIHIAAFCYGAFILNSNLRIIFHDNQFLRFYVWMIPRFSARFHHMDVSKCTLRHREAIIPVAQNAHTLASYNLPVSFSSNHVLILWYSSCTHYRDFSLPGSYRHVVVRPKDVQWYVLWHNYNHNSMLIDGNDVILIISIGKYCTMMTSPCH